jgi:molecular chaperone DnaK
MKKTLILGMALVLVLAGCGQTGNNEEEQNVNNNTNTPQQNSEQQQVDLKEQAQSVVSQGGELLDQYGDAITEEERSALEASLNDLDELSESDGIDQQELKSAMQEVQAAIRPIAEAVQSQQEEEQVGTTTQEEVE